MESSYHTGAIFCEGGDLALQPIALKVRVLSFSLIIGLGCVLPWLILFPTIHLEALSYSSVLIGLESHAENATAPVKLRPGSKRCHIPPLIHPNAFLNPMVTGEVRGRSYKEGYLMLPGNCFGLLT